MLRALVDAPAPLTTRSIVARVYADEDERPLFMLMKQVHRALASLVRRGLAARTAGPNGHRYEVSAQGREWLAADRAA